MILRYLWFLMIIVGFFVVLGLTWKAAQIVLEWLRRYLNTKN